ncbi:MAG: hypothetical protein N2234_04085 [Planctomycetota bacterium]|nr:hypothetical protein [Planctomycetota bacterium]
MIRVLVVLFVLFILGSAYLIADDSSPINAPAENKENKETPSEKPSENEKGPLLRHRLCTVASYRYSDSEPEKFNLDALWVELTANLEGVTAVTLFDFADEKTPLRKAYVDIPLILREEWKGLFSLRFGLMDVPFGYAQRLFRYDLRLPYPQVLEVLFDDTLGFYDLGIAFRGKMKTGRSKVEYEFAILNGEYVGEWTDTTSHKAFAMSLLFSPMRHFCFGGSLYDGDRRDANTGVLYNRDRVGGFAAVQYKEFRLWGEYIHGNDNSETDKTKRTDGAYIEMGIYFYKHPKLWDDRFDRNYGPQIVLRWDMLDPPKEEFMKFFTHHTHRKKLIYTVGVACDLSIWARFSIYWSRLDFGRYWSGYYFGVGDNDDRVGVVLSLQF